MSEPQPQYPADGLTAQQPAPGTRYDKAAPPRPLPLASGGRITAGILSIVLGVWMLFCSGLVFADAFESFTDTRIVAAVVLLIALATLIMGITCLSLPRGGLRLTLTVACVLAVAVVSSLLLLNVYGLLLLIPALLLGLPALLVMLNDARDAS